VTEIAAVGAAAIYVPFPFAVDDHQTTNAAYLADSCAAYLEQQKTLTVEKLVKILSGLSRKVCLEMAERARALGKPEATVDVARICMGVAV